MVTFGRALRLALGTALGLWESVVAVFVAGTLRNLVASAVALGSLFAVARGGARAGIAMIAALLLFFALAQLVRAIAIGGALRQGTARLTGGEVPSFSTAAVSSAHRSISYALWTFAVDLMKGLWQTLAVGATLFAFFTSLAERQGGVGSSLALAFALTLSIPLGLAVTLWTELAFTRSIARDQGYLVSLFDAAGELWKRPFAPLGLLLLTGVFAGAFRLTVSAAGGFPGSRENTVAMLVAGTVISAALTAFIEAAMQLVRLQGLLALTLDGEGRLPSPPAKAIPLAEVVPEAPVVDARPLAP